jgi:hypothetical protein
MAKMTYGLELETVNLTGEQIGRAIEGIDDLEFGGHFDYHGSRVLGLRHARMDGSRIVWVTERDGSLSHRSGRTAEVVSPILHGRDGLAHAGRVMRAIARAGGKVNRTCGTHLTMGVKDVSARFRRMGANAQAKVAMLVVEIYDYFNVAFQSLVSESRRNNSYCYRPWDGNRGFENRGLGNLQTFGQSSKATYAGNLRRVVYQRGQVNLNKFASTGIIEFRMHNGTLNPTKITTWALLHHQILSFVCNNTSFEDFRTFAPNLEGLMTMINVGSDLKRDLRARAQETANVYITEYDNSMWQAYMNFSFGREGQGVVV